MKLIHLSNKGIDFWNIVAVLWLGGEICTHCIEAFPVCIQSFHQLCHGIFFLVKNQLFDGIKSVTGIDCTDGTEDGTVFKLEATVKHVFSGFYSVLHQAGTEDIREKVALCDHFYVDSFICHAHQVTNFIKHGFFHIVKGSHLCDIANFFAHHLFGVTTIAVVQGDIHSLRNDKEAGNLCASLSLHIAVYTAGTAPVAGIFDGKAVCRTLFCEEIDIAFIADKGRHTDSAAHTFQCFYHQLHRCVLVDTDSHGMMRHVGILCCL